MSTLSGASSPTNIAPMRYEIVLKIFLAVVLAIGLAACSEGGSSGQADWYQRNTLYTYSGDHGNLWDRMRENMHMPTYTSSPQVREQIRYFQAHQDYLNHVIAESAPYIYYIYQQTQKRHLPAELALIPVIESEYNPYAKSRVGAMGLWQMMPGTASGFGLKRDWWYDGRKDVVASTNAALEYFNYLHSFFNGNWLLAIAAYDCGEGTVMECVRYNEYHHRSGDFWNLPLPNETQNYVPRLLAVAAIVKHPGYYGIHLAPINDEPYIEQVNIGSPIALSKAASLADVPLTTMKVLNPGLQHGTTDPRGPYVLLVPEDKAFTFKEKLATLTNNEKILWQKHIVKSKETLQKIALKYRTTVAMLREVNNLKSDKVHPDEALLVPQTNNTSNPSDNNNIIVASNSAAPDTTSKTPTVATAATKIPSATIKVAANANNTSDNNTDNNVASSTANTTATAASNTVANATPAQITYTVKHGDAIKKIAAKYHVKTKQILAWNNLSAKHTLQIGEKLVIMSKPESLATATSTTNTQTNDATDIATSIATNKATNTATQPTTNTNNTVVASAEDNASSTTVDNNQLQPLTVSYEVKNEDDLHKIARKFHVTVSKLKEVNNLADNNVKVGQILTIPTSNSEVAAATTTKTSATTSPLKPHKVIYVVRDGDYPDKIAKQFNVTTKDLKKWNQLSEHELADLQPGQKLIVHDEA